MRKVFKFLAGTFGNWYPQTYNSGASIMFSLQPTSSMPNYKSVAQEKNNSFMTSTQLSRMTMTPSRDPTLTYSFNRMPSLTAPDMSNTLANLYKLQMTTPYSEQLTKHGTDLLSKDLSKEREVPPTLNKSNWTEKAQNIMNIGSSIVPRKPLSGLTTTLDAGYDTTAALVGMANPVVGTVMQGVGLATDAARALGLGTDLVTTEDLILDSKFLALSPLGLVNSLGAKKALTINKGLDYLRVRADMGAGYGGLSDTFNTAEKYAGKNIGNLFGQRDRANSKIYNANYDLARLQKIWGKSYLDTAILGTQSDMAFNKENLRMKGGWLDGAISFGRKGMIIEPSRLRMIRHITLSYKPLMYTEAELSEEEIVQFKNGGSFNVIPEGSLHARLHHMEDADGLTKKGIPVVVEKDGGELELQAEIELNEIIFRLEVTNEIEKLMKDGSDNAAIECGKMLVKEIFENTQDRTGLIESLEEPKKGLEEVVKEHRVFQEGGIIPPELDQKQAGEEPVGYTEDGIPLYIKGDGSIGPSNGEDNLFDLIKNSNANWAKRLQDPKRKFIPLKEGGWGNFKLKWSEDETGVMVYPEILEINGKLVDLSEDRDKAWESAVNNKDYIYFPSREAAEWFTKNYKKYYRGFDKKEKQ